MAWTDTPAADGAAECSALVAAAARLRWSAPELTVQFAARAIARGAEAATRTHAESLLAAGLAGLGRAAEAVEPGVAALRSAVAAGRVEDALAQRTVLAACARALGDPLAGAEILRPAVLGPAAKSLPAALAARALAELAACLAHLAGRDDVEDTLTEADRLLAADDTLPPPHRRVERALVCAHTAAYHRRHGDTEGAADSAHEGLAILPRPGAANSASAGVHGAEAGQEALAIGSHGGVAHSGSAGGHGVGAGQEALAIGSLGGVAQSVSAGAHGVGVGQEGVAIGSLGGVAHSVSVGGLGVEAGRESVPPRPGDAIRDAPDGAAGLDLSAVRARLVYELTFALLDDGALDEAAAVCSTLLGEPVRATAASWVGRLRLAIATRVHLPAGRTDLGRTLLLDTVDTAQRHGHDTILADAWTFLAHGEETAARPVEALHALRSARAAEHRHHRAAARARRQLTAEFAPDRDPDRAAALLRAVVRPPVPAVPLPAQSRRPVESAAAPDRLPATGRKRAVPEPPQTDASATRHAAGERPTAHEAGTANEETGMPESDARHGSGEPNAPHRSASRHSAPGDRPRAAARPAESPGAEADWQGVAARSAESPGAEADWQGVAARPAESPGGLVDWQGVAARSAESPGAVAGQPGGPHDERSSQPLPWTAGDSAATPDLRVDDPGFTLILVRVEPVGRPDAIDPEEPALPVGDDGTINALASRVRDLAPNGTELVRSDRGEFAVLLPRTPTVIAEQFAAIIRKQAARGVWLADVGGRPVTVHTAVANHAPAGVPRGLDTLLHVARTTLRGDPRPAAPVRAEPRAEQVASAGPGRHETPAGQATHGAPAPRSFADGREGGAPGGQARSSAGQRPSSEVRVPGGTEVPDEHARQGNEERVVVAESGGRAVPAETGVAGGPGRPDGAVERPSRRDRRAAEAGPSDAHQVLSRFGITAAGGGRRRAPDDDLDPYLTVGAAVLPQAAHEPYTRPAATMPSVPEPDDIPPVDPSPDEIPPVEPGPDQVPTHPDPGGVPPEPNEIPPVLPEPSPIPPEPGRAASAAEPDQPASTHPESDMPPLPTAAALLDRLSRLASGQDQSTSDDSTVDTPPPRREPGQRSDSAITPRPTPAMAEWLRRAGRPLPDDDLPDAQVTETDAAAPTPDVPAGVVNPPPGLPASTLDADDSAGLGRSPVNGPGTPDTARGPLTARSPAAQATAPVTARPPASASGPSSTPAPGPAIDGATASGSNSATSPATADDADPDDPPVTSPRRPGSRRDRSSSGLADLLAEALAAFQATQPSDASTWSDKPEPAEPRSPLDAALAARRPIDPGPVRDGGGRRRAPEDAEPAGRVRGANEDASARRPAMGFTLAGLGRRAVESGANPAERVRDARPGGGLDADRPAESRRRDAGRSAEPDRHDADRPAEPDRRDADRPAELGRRATERPAESSGRDADRSAEPGTRDAERPAEGEWAPGRRAARRAREEGGPRDWVADARAADPADSPPPGAAQGWAWDEGGRHRSSGWAPADVDGA